MKKAIDKAKAAVANEPKIKKITDEENRLLPEPLAPDLPLNPMVTSASTARTAQDVPEHELGNQDVKAIAGPAEAND